MGFARTLHIGLLAAMLALLPVMTCQAASGALATEKLVPVSGDAQATRAVILFGGIYETYHYWDTWAPLLEAPGVRVFGFDHDHSATSMSEAAKTLAQEITGLNAVGIDEVTVVAHSMAGLVSKAALNTMVEDGSSARFVKLELLAFGTPWGGFAFADSAHWLPGGTFISRAIGLPMGPEIGPGSPYMASLPQRWPANMHLQMYVGSLDRMANPGSGSTRHRYSEIEEDADTLTVLDGLRHKDYSTISPVLLGLAEDREQNALRPVLPADALLVSTHVGP
jgi:triacylglycerol esterase/lipase EstA (alpha/beta hydrolase family)